MGWEDLTPSEAVENGDWIRPRLHPFAAYDAGAVIPTGFAAYARILHPAFIEDVEVRWSEVAGWSGKAIHPEAQFPAIAAPLPGHGARPGPFISPPRNAHLSDSQVRVLAGLLAKHTGAPDHCWFCLWEGYGYLSEVGVMEVRAYRDSLAGRWARWRDQHVRASSKKARRRPAQGRRVMPNHARSYLLFTGTLNEVAGWEDGPNLCWPDDRAWCVASEIDLPYSYVGGSEKLIAAILEHPDLEALPSETGHGITYDSDKLNSIA
ncbi:MAG: hypothetical protein ACYDAL_06925 [Candidatus Dormibacteraceae bacterium]